MTMPTPELDKVILDMIVMELPLFPPLKPGGEVTVHEMYPDLTASELDYIMSRYTGTMARG